MTAGSPAAPGRHRRSSPFNTLPGGIPLSAIFALCDAHAQDDDIGPCLADLLRGVIDKARPDFATGLEINGDSIVLEPLRLDDIDPQREKSFQVHATNLKVHGISTLNINDITFSSNELALNLSFDRVSATGDVLLKFLFLSADTRVHLKLSDLTVLVHANWMLDVHPDDPSRLDIVLQNAAAKFELGSLGITVENLGNVGQFLQNIINANSKTLVKFLIPGLERSISKKLNRKLNRIKIAD